MDHRYPEETRQDATARILGLYPTNLAPVEICNSCQNQCAKSVCSRCNYNCWPPTRFVPEVVAPDKGEFKK